MDTNTQLKKVVNVGNWGYKTEYYLDSEGLKQGLQRDWLPDGTMVWSINFKDGAKEGLEEKWWSNGNKKEICNYLGGKMHGFCCDWWIDGSKHYEYSYDRNVEVDGISRSWWPNGQLMIERHHRDGKTRFIKSYHKNGDLKFMHNLDVEYNPVYSFL